MRKQIATWIGWVGTGCLIISMVQGYWPGAVIGVLIILLAGYLWKRVEK